MLDIFLKYNQKVSDIQVQKNYQFQSLMMQNENNQNLYEQSHRINNLLQLRGGGCGKSKTEKNINLQQKKDENSLNLELLPNNYLTNFDNCLKVIIEESMLIGDANKRKEVIKKILWFNHNREYLNMFCIVEKKGRQIYDSVLNKFEKLLEVLIVYLRNSGFICHLVLQISNELLRIIYSFQLGNSERSFKEEKKVNYLSQLSEFDTQLEIEQANVWKTGIEYEVKIMKIMIMNSQTDSTEGSDLLINFFLEAGKSIIQLSPSENLVQTILNGGKFLLKKGIEKKLYRKETYQTYYLFQLIKWSIIQQLKSQHSVYKQIKQLKDIFSQYILVSDNWILHFSWIQMIFDIIGYRPLVDKLKLQDEWKYLIENNLIQCVSYNQNEAIINLFTKENQIYDIEYTNILDTFGKKKFALFSQFIIKGDVTQNINLWDYYREFTFKQQKDNVQKEYEIVLANSEQEVLQKLINNLKQEKDEIMQIYEGIIQSFPNYNKQPSDIQISIFQDDQDASSKQILKSFKKMIIITNKIQELSSFEAQKLKMLKPYLDKFKNSNDLENIKKLQLKIDDFVKKDVKGFQDLLLNYLIFTMKFVSQISINNLFIEFSQQIDINTIANQLDIHEFQKIIVKFEAEFNQFSLNLSQYKQNFLKFILEEKDIQQTNILVQFQNITDIIEFNCKGELINKIIKKLQNENNINVFTIYESKLESLDDAKQNLIDCKFIIILLHFIKQFSNIQTQYVEIIYQQLKNYAQLHNEEMGTGKEICKDGITAILQQQQLKITQLKNQNVNESGIKSFQSSCKSILAQIKSDFIFIKKEIDKLQNKEINREILKFLAEVQFKILQAQNQPQDLSNLSQLLEDYQQKIDNINKQDQKDTQNQNNLQDFEEIFQDFQYEYQKNKEKFINDIKETKKYYKQYENLLILQINLLYEKVDTELNQLQTKRNNFFSEKVQAQIKLLSDEFLNQNQIEKVEILLKTPDFLSFYYTLSNKEYSKGLNGDKINDSIWQDIKNAYQDNKVKLLDLIDTKPSHKVRECLAYNLIKIQQSTQEQQINSFTSKQIQQMWVYEKDQRVRNLLKNKELIEIQKYLFSQDLDNLSSSIKDELKERMERLENLQNQIKLEGNLQKRELLQVQIKQNYDELEESLDNIQEMSEAIDISLLFLKDISKDVKQIKGQIDKLQDSINQVGDDIRKLRGKNYKELLDMRKEKILFQSKLTEVDSVYVQLMTIEYDPVTGQVIKTSNNAETSFLMAEKWNDFIGEINEFIWDESKQKDVMLLSGYAGSGKSKAARKIEEFIWKQKGINSKWIPIFVSLPTIKNPKQNLFEQALESENYQFDKYQIRELKEAIQSKKEYIILILDSYDEMKQEFIQSNLILTNKLFQDLSIDKVNSQMKVIITTRKEILNTVGYQTWFYGESLSKLKEIQLQNFDQNQQQEYLNQYVELSVKRKIKLLYEFVKQISGQKFDLSEFLEIWSLMSQQIKNCIQKSESQEYYGIFQNKEEEIIIGKIKSHKILQIITEEQVNGLKKELLALWSAYKFRQSIQSVKIQDLLKTPFMLEIVVQVLPNMTSKFQGSTQIKEIFTTNYLKLRKQFRFSQNEIKKYINKFLPFQSQKQISVVNIDNEEIHEDENNEEYLYKIDKAKLDEIVDSLDDQKFFQNYSIVSRLIRNRDSISIDSKIIKLNPDDINIVLMALKMKKFTVFDFYESFINFYHEQQIQKQRELGKIPNYESFIFDINQFSCSLALDMILKDLSQISYKPQGKLDLKSNYKIEQVIDDWLKQYFDVEDEYKKLIRSCILLSAKGSTYSFTHKSIQEFYVAKYIFDLLMSLTNIDSIIQYNQKLEKPQQNIKNNNDQNRELQNKDSELSQQNIQNKIDQNREYNNDNVEQFKDILLKSLFNYKSFILSSDKYRGVINFIKEKLMNIENMNEKLIKIVKLSKFKNLDYSRAASNSIFLLNQMNVYLGSQDFNSIKLINTNISGLSLFDSDLSFSEFQNVEINSCNLNLADLSNVKWSNVICKEKPLLKGHTQSVIEVQFSPNGQYIASIQGENQIYLWNLNNCKLIKKLEIHTDQVNTLQFTQDSQYLFSGSNDRKIIKWDIRNPNMEVKHEIINLGFKVKKVYIQSDSKMLYASGGDGEFLILDLSKDGKIQEIIYNDIDNQYIKFAMHPFKSVVAILSKQTHLYLINYETQNKDKLEVVQDLQNDYIMNIIFSYDGNLLAAATSETVVVWNIAQEIIKIQLVLNFPGIVLSTIMFDQDNKKLIFGYDDFIFMRDINQSQIKSQNKKEKCFEINISPQASIIAIVYEKKISFIDAIIEKPINEILFDLQPNRLKFSNDGSYLSFLLKENDIIKQFRILDVLKLTVICLLPWNTSFWYNYVISNDFEKLYIFYQCSSNNYFSRIIKINTKKIHKEVIQRQYNFKVQQFCVKPNSWIIAFYTNEENSIKIYDLNKNQQISEPISNEQKEVQSFQFSPFQNQLAVGYEEQILIWNLESVPFEIQGKLNLDNKILKYINYSLDGQLISLVFKDNTFQIYDIKNNELQKVFENNSILGQIQYSLDNNMIGFLDNNGGQIVILSRNNNYKQIVLEGEDYSTNQIIFTEDSKSLIFYCSNQLILWDLQTQQIKQRQKTQNSTDAKFSYNRNLIVLHEGGILELWRCSQSQFIFIGSQVFDQIIINSNFIYDDNHILLLQENSELVLSELNCFQFEQTFSQNFTDCAISPKHLIALSYGCSISVLSDEFEKKKSYIGNASVKSIQYGDIQHLQHLQFFQHQQNLILALDKYSKVNIWDFEKGVCISCIATFSKYKKVTLQLCSQDKLLISQHKKTVLIWNIEDLENISKCGFHSNIDCFSILQDGERGMGINNEEEVIIQNIFNIQFAFPQNEEIKIKQLFMSFKKQFFIILYRTIYLDMLLILQIDNNQEFSLKPGVQSIGFCEEKNYIAIQINQKIELASFFNNTLKIFDTFDLQDQTDEFGIQFTNDGEGLLLSSKNLIRIFSITNKQKMVCRYLYQFDNDRTQRIIQAQLYFKHDLPKQHLLFILDSNSFKIFDILKQLQFVHIKNIQNSFTVSLDEKVLCFIGQNQLSLFDNENFHKKQLYFQSEHNFSIDRFKRDSFIFISDKKINYIQPYSRSIIEIGVLQDQIDYMICLPQKEWLALSTPENNIIFWDIKTKNQVGTLKGNLKKITSLSVSPDVGILASASDDKLIKLWNIDQNESSEIQQAHSYEIIAIAFSYDGKYFASASKNEPIFYWDFTNKKFITQLKGDENIEYIQFLEVHGKMTVWNIQNPFVAEILYNMDQCQFPIQSLSVSPKDQNLILIHSNYITKINFEMIEHQQMDKNISISTNSISYSFLEDDQFIYFDIQKMELIILNFLTNKQLQTFKCRSEVIQIAQAQKGTLVLCLNRDGQLYYIQKQKYNQWIRKWVFCSICNQFLLSSDGQFLYQFIEASSSWLKTTSRYDTILHDLQKLQDFEINTILEFSKIQREHVFVTSDLILVAIANFNQVEIYEMKNEKLINKYFGCQQLIKPQISEDKKYITCLQNESYDNYNTIYLWEIGNPANLKKLKIDNCNLIQYQFSVEDSNKIYTYHTDGNIRHLNITTNQIQVVKKLPDNIIQKDCHILFSLNLEVVIYQVEKTKLNIINFQEMEPQCFDFQEEVYLFDFYYSKQILAVAFFRKIKLIKGKKQSNISLQNYKNSWNFDGESISFLNDGQELVFLNKTDIYLYKIDEELETQILGCWNVDNGQKIFTSTISNLEFSVLTTDSVYHIKFNPSILHFDSKISERQLTINAICENLYCFSPDNKYLAILNSFLQLQELQNPQIIHNFKDYQGSQIQFQTIEILVIAQFQELTFLNFAKIDQIVEIKKILFNDEITRIAFISKFSLITFENSIRFDLIDQLQEDQCQAIYQSSNIAVFQEKGDYFALSNSDSIKIMNIQDIINSERCIQLKNNNGKVIYSSDGDQIFLCSPDKVLILDSKNFNVDTTINLNSEFLENEDQRITFKNYEYNHKSKNLLFTSNSGVYSVQNLKENFNFIKIIEEKNWEIQCIALSPSGDLFLAGVISHDLNIIKLFQIQQAQELCNNDLLNDKVKAIKFCPDEINFVAGLMDGSINLYSINIKQTNFFIKQKLEPNYQIICYQSFSKQSLLSAFGCILQDSNISSKQTSSKQQQSILELFNQKSCWA